MALSSEQRLLASVMGARFALACENVPREELDAFNEWVNEIAPRCLRKGLTLGERLDHFREAVGDDNYRAFQNGPDFNAVFEKWFEGEKELLFNTFSRKTVDLVNKYNPGENFAIADFAAASLFFKGTFLHDPKV